MDVRLELPIQRISSLRSSTSAVVTLGEQQLSRTIVKPFREYVSNGRSAACDNNSLVASPTLISGLGASSSTFRIVGDIGASSQEY